jgi:hypothetical protein
MKKLIVLICLVSTIAKADEGMWLPQLINALNFADMKKNGFKLTAEQIYSINKSSMKDAVVQFGGGCTAEIISNEGLILTNHHCGFSSIAALSSVANDYLKNGYWAMNRGEELRCENLTVLFINRIEDVTSKVIANLNPKYSEIQRDSAIKASIKVLETAAKVDGYDAFIRPFFYGNEYYLFVTETYRDIRLVGAPPESIGKFGDETDNWVWPRHNADFSMFRIYADKNNKPADYNKDNVPYKPKYFFPISLKGYEKGDFTMVYGFPGRTTEYLSSNAVDLLMNQQDPIRVRLREKRLAVLDEAMKKNDTLRLMYTGRYAGIANYYKKWGGEMLGLQKYDALNKKKAFEQGLLDLIKTDAAKTEKINGLFSSFKKTYSDYAPLSKQYDYYTECLLGIDALRYANNYTNIFAELKKKQAGKENKFDKLLEDLKKGVPFKSMNPATDKKLCNAMLTVYQTDIDKANRPFYLDSLFTAHNNDASKLTDFLYSNSSFNDNAKAQAMLNDLEKSANLYERDPMYLLATAITKYYQTAIIPQMQYLDLQINDLQKEYVKVLRETYKTKKFYPDANSTLRVAYGKVDDYAPRDGVKYAHYTTLDGLVDKNSLGIEDYYVKPRLLELYKQKDYGMYADKNGKLRTAFIASNHTTGGNSGSPVLNAKGELIGTNFDRNWEGTMSDVMYNVNQCRNITLDVRFTLWIVDKYAGAGHLLKEMKLVK